VQFKELYRSEFFYFYIFFVIFLSVFVAMFNNVFCSPAKSNALLHIWFKILTSLDTRKKSVDKDLQYYILTNKKQNPRKF